MIRIELDDVEEGSWNTVRPVVADGEDPSDPTLYRTTPTLLQRLAIPASATYAKLPDTTGQAWRWVDSSRIERVTVAGATIGAAALVQRRFVIEHRFSSTTALVAMRYPYTPSFYASEIAHWKQLSARAQSPLRVIDLGKTRRGNPMAAMVISGPGWPQDRQRPIAVIYGREHGTETDASWVAHGALEFLISDHPRAQAIRAAMTTIVIPCIDPDAAGAPCYENLTHKFSREEDETRRIAAPFLDLTNAGYRIDLVIDLHNVQGGQVQWHAFSVIAEPEPAKRAAQELWVNKYLKSAFAERGYGFRKNPGGVGEPRFRLAGFLSYMVGSTMLAVELNVQFRNRRLRLDETQEMGERFVTATHQLVTSGTTAWIAARAVADDRRRARIAAFKLRPKLSPLVYSPIDAEWEVAVRSVEEEQYRPPLEPNDSHHHIQDQTP